MLAGELYVANDERKRAKDLCRRYNARRAQLRQRQPGHPRLRAGVESAAPITIHDGVWIGAGSVVTRSIPANVVAVGNPCRVLKQLTPRP